MKKENNNVVICPPCGENVGLPTKRGANKALPLLPLLPRLSAVLPQSGKTCLTTLLPGYAVLPPQGGKIEWHNSNLALQGREITTRGFTLIELLVVVLIIGILAAVAVPQYQNAVLKSRYATIKNLVKSVATAQEVYYLSHGKYATRWSDLDIDISSNCTNSSCSFDWGSCDIAISTSEYMVSCTLITKGLPLRYGLWLAHSTAFPGRAQCFAGTKDLTDITNKICKIETQTKYPAYFPGENSSAWLYN